MDIVIYQPEHFDDVNSLWHEVFPDYPPWNAAEVTIPAKIETQPDLFLVAVHDG